MNRKNKKILNFNIECKFNEKGVNLIKIVEELFLLNLKNQYHRASLKDMRF